MLEALLTLLIPRQVPRSELTFHERFVLNVYREYYDHFEATGYRDHEMLIKLKKKTMYSMSVLFWYHPHLCGRILRFRNRAWNVKKPLTPLEDIYGVLSAP